MEKGVLKNLLRSKEYWIIVEKGVLIVLPTTPAPKQKKLVEKNQIERHKGQNYMFQSIERKIIKTTLDKISSKDIWNSMSKKY